MDMTMTFLPWSTYQTSIVFDFWKPSTVFEFVLSWIFVCLLTIFYQWFKFCIVSPLAAKIAQRSRKFKSDDSESFSLIDHPDAADDIFTIRLQHAIFSAVSYAFSLFLMLIAMTYVPTLFLSLIIGYGFGDYFFHIPTHEYAGNSGTTRSGYL